MTFYQKDGDDSDLLVFNLHPRLGQSCCPVAIFIACLACSLSGPADWKTPGNAGGYHCLLDFQMPAFGSGSVSNGFALLRPAQVGEADL